ncbi:DUF29 domain-containing protein [Piscirickettsia litoralis]|uniref:DUF29 domain-containing protein n=1 Tax=Piscirickettsia litoralis TaxID=1891921 RepID=A0ABX2ZZG6_9GAMM|nr:DUF29 domain-containing protein [Piscirickettsia litoralis]ODN41974.1 hypothetical protein BGC07_02120 [Piscirickettsia litoralis]
MARTEHDLDIYAWAHENAELLRQGKFNEVDMVNVIEELEDLGNSKRDQLTARLKLIIQHLLKWQYQPSHRGRSWSLTIKNNRRDVEGLLEDVPSLKSKIDECFVKAYKRGAVAASDETDMPIKKFPQSCPYTLEEVLNPEFMPD